jgi:predicted small secreted protein
MIKSPRASALQNDNSGFRRTALLGLAVLMVGGLMVSGCNTVAGAGQDVKATGNAVTNSADTVKSKL